MQSVLAQLEAIRRRRRASRVLIGASWLALIVASALGVLLIIDWYFNLPNVYRVVFLSFALAGIIWAGAHRVLPWFARRETADEIALDIGHQQHWFDLLAALQFYRRGEATSSKSLEHAVIDRVATQPIRVELEDIALSEQRKTAAVRLGGVSLVVLIVAFSCFGHLRVFAQRMLLASPHYPTRTKIEAVAVNGLAVLAPGDPALALRTATVVQKQPARISVQCGGEIAGEAYVELRTASGTSQVELRPKEQLAPPALQSFTTEVTSAATSAIWYRICAGDARTQWGELQIEPLPIVALSIAVTPPDYAKATRQASETSHRALTVAPGSRVVFTIRSGNNKQLREAWLELTNTAGRKAKVPLHARGKFWSSEHAPPSVLDDVRSTLQYRLHVVDEAGLRPATPITGQVECPVDQPPIVSISGFLHQITTHARPRLQIAAQDDFGLKYLTAVVEVFAADPSGKPPGDELGMARTRRSIPIEASTIRRQVFDGQIHATAEVHVPVGELGVQPGQQVRVTLQATDDRGALPGVTVASEPVVWTVVPDDHVIRSVLQDDDEIERQLSEWIELQRKAGGSP